ncbi:MAG: BON domain-containing protein [Sandaracinaceae bacterium]
MLVLGTSRAAARIEGDLTDAGILVGRHDAPAAADAAVDEATRALVVVPPIANVSVARYCRKLHEAHAQLPVFVAMRGPLPRRSVRALYDGGGQAVFAWPAEREALVRTAFRLAGAPLAVGGGLAAATNIALEELVNVHLRTASTAFGEGLVARARHRFVILEGTVDALYKVHAAQRVAEGVPGVEDVVADAVRVVGPERADRELADAVRLLLKHATEVDPSTIAVRAEGARVVVSGTVADQDELRRALDLVRHVRGVMEVESYLTVSATAREHDRTLARRLQAAIDTRAPKAGVEVAVFGGVAVLAGRVRGAAERSALVELVAGQAGVERVVDKLRVAKARGSSRR